MSTPNLLIFLTDQHRADHLGCYGNTVVRTPDIDALAHGGWRFDRTYVANRVCMPNRAAMMTGRLPSINGARGNGTPLPLESVTFADVLSDFGYRTVLIGKSHLQNMEDRPPALLAPAPVSTRASARFPEARRMDLHDAAYRQELRSSWRGNRAKFTTSKRTLWSGAISGTTRAHVSCVGRWLSSWRRR